jgi:hypothetical protein
LAKAHGQSLIVVSFYYFEEVTTQDLKDHAEMIAVMSLMDEGVEQSHHMGVVSASPPLRTVALFLHLLQYLYFVESGLHIVGRTLLDLNCNVGIILEIFAKPNGGEVTPA